MVQSFPLLPSKFIFLSINNDVINKDQGQEWKKEWKIMFWLFKYNKQFGTAKNEKLN